MGADLFVFSPLEDTANKFSGNANVMNQNLGGQNIDHYELQYAMTQGKFKLRLRTICFIKNDKAYLMTFTTEVSKYEQYKKASEELLASFILK